MKSERNLKVKDLETEVEDHESELFIGDLGKVRGGQSIPIGCGPADGPCEGHDPLLGAISWLEDLLKYVPGEGLERPDQVTTLAAFGEE